MITNESLIAVESVIDQLSLNGGLYLYDKYLKTKDNAHCAFRLMQCFEEEIQFSFFPGDPGEDEEVFEDNWTAESEPLPCEIDHWATKIVKSKQIYKVENQIDDAPSSARSKRAPSIASSRKTVKIRKLQQKPSVNESELRSKFGDSVKEKSEKKENVNNINVSRTYTQQTLKESGPQYQLIPLDMDPPREIPDDERIMRDRKERQLKIRENELKELREKEERDKMRMKSKMDQFAEIEKNEYTYDLNGQIMIVKKPKIQPITQALAPDVNLNPDLQNTQQKQQPKQRVRIQSAKPPQQKEIAIKKDQKAVDQSLEEKAQQEVEDNIKKMMQHQEETLKDYGLQKDLDIQAGIVMTDKEGKRFRGPNLDRQDRMTLQEYQKIAADFQVMNQEQLSRYGSQKRLQSPENLGSQLDFIQEDQESIDMSKRKLSKEKIHKNLGADELYERDGVTQFRINLRAKRKNLQSANVKNLNQNVINKHNEKVRLTSAKVQQDIRVRKQSAKGVRERIFNYDNQINGVDFPPTSSQDIISSKMSEGGRPMSGHPSNLLNKKNLQLGKQGNTKTPGSLIDEFNKKLVEKGTTFGVMPNELPEVSKYLQKKQERPMTSKPILKTVTSKKKLGASEINEGFASAGAFGSIMSIGDNNNAASASVFSNKTILNKKGPRERIISAKLPRENEKLPPPPFGKTMGHGFLQQQKQV